MAAPARFLFDTDFSAPAAPVAAARPAEPPVPMIPLADHMAALAAARTEADEDGFMRGRMDADVRATERIADEAARLVAIARSLLASVEADRAAVEAEAIDLAVEVARKLAATLVAREPLAEIRELVRECLGPLRKAPHLVIRLADTDGDRLRPEVDRIARETGFEGKIIILGEPDIARGDCRIEWADGGIVRDTAALVSEIDTAIARYVEARGAPGDAGAAKEGKRP